MIPLNSATSPVDAGTMAYVSDMDRAYNLYINKFLYLLLFFRNSSFESVLQVYKIPIFHTKKTIKYNHSTECMHGGFWSFEFLSSDVCMFHENRINQKLWGRIQEKIWNTKSDKISQQHEAGKRYRARVGKRCHRLFCSNFVSVAKKANSRSTQRALISFRLYTLSKKRK